MLTVDRYSTRQVKNSNVTDRDDVTALFKSTPNVLSCNMILQIK